MKPTRRKKPEVQATTSLPISPGRRRVFRAVAAVGLPLVLLGVMEICLRLAGVGYETGFWLRDGADPARLVENPRFGWRFFPRGMARSPRPMSVLAEKPAGTLRVVVFGESAAYGDPDPAFGLPRVLEVLLRERFGGRQVEVINVAMTAINSHVIREIARDCGRLRADAWVIYMGNNEVVGPFGAGTVFSKQAPPLWLARATMAVKRLRVAQWIEAGLERIGSRGGGQVFTGMDMFSENRVGADDPRMKRVYAHFERNLREIVGMGMRAKAEVLLCTVPTNLKDCPPFAPVAGGTNAESLFREAQGSLKSGRVEEAGKLFARARDEDGLRFRADSAINRVILDLAKQGEAKLLDLEGILNSQSAGKVAGAEFFYEHVHLNFSGNYRAARAIAEGIGGTGNLLSEEECAARLAWTDWDRLRTAEILRKRFTRPPFTFQFDHAQREAANAAEIRRLRAGLDAEGLKKAAQVYEAALRVAPEDWVLHENFAALLAAMGDYAGAAAHSRKVVEKISGHAEKWARLGLNLQRAGKMAEGEEAIRHGYAIDRESTDVLFGLALAKLDQKRTSAGLAILRRVVSERPDFSEARVALGDALAREGRKEEAIAQFEKVLELEPGQVKARVGLNKLRYGEGTLKEKVAELGALAAKNPEDGSIAVLYGKALLANGDFAEAKKQFARAVELAPRNGEAHYFLGEALTRENLTEQGLEQFAMAARLMPGDVSAHLNLGVALAQARRFEEALGEFETVLKLEPTHEAAKQYAAMARARLKK